jgi:predicted ABC-type transport system involved in lysophospholipase L1 biosynthesis ATPase subunit
MKEQALRYARFVGGNPIVVEVPRGGVSRRHLPNADAKAHLVTAVLKARADAGEELELLGEPTAALDAKGRDRLRRRVAAVSPVVGLISTLNAWENISLPAAYHGAPPLAEVAAVTQQVLSRFGVDAGSFLARLPDELGTLERRLAAFVRLLVAAPELALLDDIGEGLSRVDRERVSAFEAEYRTRQPLGTLLYLDAQEAA